MSDISSFQLARGVDPRALTTGARQVVGLRLDGAPAALEMRALLIGARIDTRQLDEFIEPESLPPGSGGMVFVFRYGVVVLFGASPEAEAAILARLRDQVVEPVEEAELETATIAIRPSAEEQVDANGRVVLRDAGIERLLLTATVLAQSVVLARDEVRIAEAFDRIEPLVHALRTQGRAGLPIRRVMQHIGDVLATRHRMLGRAQISEKPDMLWEHPELERLYGRLEAEYELNDRASVIARKLDAIGDANDVLLDVVQDKRMVRLELAIIALIAFEIALTLVEKAGI
ncbi:MAG TPA: RMD1 family protein [Sphingobium sp.]|nr:RMD1 family protein [Sphingobium sp.]